MSGGSVRAKPGTSPRLWGDWQSITSRCRRIRYIPTPVGRFSPSEPVPDRLTVHPHACGEISLSFSACSLMNGTSHACGEIDIALGKCHFVAGTSPRLWGDWVSLIGRSFLYRYIPTPVGEIRPALCNHADNHGTSPRLWGDFSIRSCRVQPLRYIPTPVGRFG